RRYSSASEFASDVRHHLGDEPITAGPVSHLYRLKKFVRRHRRMVIAIATAATLLAAQSIVMTVLYLRAEASRMHAELEIQRNAIDAESLQAALLGDTVRYRELTGRSQMLQRSVEPLNERALTVSAVNRLVLMKLLQDGFLADPEIEPPAGTEIDVETLVGHALLSRDAQTLRTAALAAQMLKPETAGTFVDRILHILPPGAGRLDDVTQRNLEQLLETMEGQSFHPFNPAENAALEHVYRVAVERQRKTLGDRSVRMRTLRKRLAGVLEEKAQRQLQDRDSGSTATLQESLALFESVGEPPDHVARIRSDLGAAMAAQGHLQEAENLLRRALETLGSKEGMRGAYAQVAAVRLAAVLERTGDGVSATEIRTRLPRVFVEDVRELGVMRRDGEIVSEPGGCSGALGNDILWAFGDRLALSNAGDAQMGELRNATAGLTLTPDEITFNRRHNGSSCVDPCGAHWSLTPASIASDPRSHRFFLFYRRVLQQDSLPQQSIPSLAVCGTDLRCQRTNLFAEDEPPWGSAAVVDGENLYVFACEAEGLSASCRLARVPLASVLSRRSWRFFAGDGHWSTEWRDAQPILTGGMEGGILSVHRSPFFGGFVAVSSRVVDSKLSIRTAPFPEGPWSDPDIEIDTLRSGPGWSWTTWGVAHPELSTDDGKVEYFTYHRRTGTMFATRIMKVRFGKKTMAPVLAISEPTH
ncbi:MAG TPA: DUF4185 domain-containing protein, partial [Thermoanaerobaculia bacterium]|nr:DUF4185 domain-containing protein [Thermoanaerobaculia bacterium]